MKKRDRGGDGDRTVEAPSGGPRARVARVALLALVLLAIAGSYAYYVVRHRESLVSRDLRSLTMLTAQIESVLAEARGTLRAYAQDSTEPAQSVIWPDETSPREYREFEVLRRNPLPPLIDPAKPVSASIDQQLPSGPRRLIQQRIALDGGKARLELRYVGRENGTLADASGVIDLKRVAASFFAQEFLSIFEMVLLAAPDGRVLYAIPTSSATPLPVPHRERGEVRDTARRLGGGLVISDLGALTRHTGWRKWERLEPRTLGGASHQTLVRTTDRQYYLFTVPLRFAPEECPDCITDGATAKTSNE
ncbi:MAG TPA: hypothetical protein VEU30_04230, partial [Thermoanaerobaculia bacterium]|nr:hypothetical protein [Thermoanaerobaculia bacterium]